MSRAVHAYRTAHATTATPGQLVVMLYDGALRFLDQAAQAYGTGDRNLGNQAVVRAERILLELMASLDFRYPEIASPLLALYRYWFVCLSDARRWGSVVDLLSVRRGLQELREAWAEADRCTRNGRPMA